MVVFQPQMLSECTILHLFVKNFQTPPPTAFGTIKVGMYGIGEKKPNKLSTLLELIIFLIPQVISLKCVIKIISCLFSFIKMPISYLKAFLSNPLVLTLKCPISKYRSRSQHPGVVISYRVSRLPESILILQTAIWIENRWICGNITNPNNPVVILRSRWSLH